MGRQRKVTEFPEPQVAFALSDKEQHVKARELAEMCDDIDQRRAAAAADASGARKAIRALEKRRRLLAECVRTGNEMRNAQEKLFREPAAPPKPNGAHRTSDTAADAFAAPAEPSAVPDERDAFLAKGADAPAPSPASDDGADDGDLDPHDAFIRDKTATVAPVQPAPIATVPPPTPFKPAIPPAMSTADYADAWDPPEGDVVVPDNAAAKLVRGNRKKKTNGTDGPPEAA